MRPPPAALVPPYLCAQAVAIAVWWLMLWLWPSTRRPFVAPGWPEATLLAFWLPDLTVLVAGSLLAAIGMRRGRPWARAALWVVAGAVAYATLWCAGAFVVTGGGWLPLAMMLACSSCMAWAVSVWR